MTEEELRHEIDAIISLQAVMQQQTKSLVKNLQRVSEVQTSMFYRIDKMLALLKFHVKEQNE
jgi:hypothetical protein